MIAEIVAVGTELLMGQIANTNAQYITAGLQEAGIDVLFHSVVGDNPERLKKLIQTGMERSDVIIVTGGLGPTKDDLTKETIAELMDCELVVDEESAEKMKAYFAKTGKTMTENNLKQTLMPKYGVVLKNDNGTAPGCIMSKAGTDVILLPGPPFEMRPMFDEQVMPFLMNKNGYRIVSKFLKVFGIGESEMVHRLGDIIDTQDEVTIAPYVGNGDLILRVTTKVYGEADAERIIQPTIDAIMERIGEFVFDFDGRTMAEVVLDLLLKNRLSMAVAESCTGGMIADAIVSLPGASDVFDRGLVTYSNEAKTDELAVSENTLAEHGAVSEETAREMVEGLYKKTGCDVCVATTGIAGPGGGTDEKPVGLVYIGVCYKGKSFVRRFVFSGNRSRVRLHATINALNLVREIIG